MVSMLYLQGASHCFQYIHEDHSGHICDAAVQELGMRQSGHKQGGKCGEPKKEREKHVDIYLQITI